MLPAIYPTEITRESLSLAYEVVIAPGLGGKGLYVSCQTQGFVSGDGYITEADALDLTLRLAAHFGYEVTRPEPEPVEPALPEVGKVYAVTENYPYLASLVRGDLVRVVSLGTSSAGFPVARVRRVADADTYPYSVHAVDHLEPEPVDEHESTPARYPCDCPLCAN